MKSWLRVAARRDVMRRSLRVSLLVGTILIVINQGDRLLNGELSLEIALKMLLTYLVPYGVSTYASVSSILSR